MSVSFDHRDAFSRNLGLLTKSELEKIKTLKVAIPGMGGVGGVHLINFIRLGFENFHIADMDLFGIENFNRQYGANMNTINKSKCQVMKQYALEINPNAFIKTFDEGINEQNIESFLSGVDILIDGLDVFCLRIRRAVINRALELKIPVITAGPIGMGTTFVCFKPGGPNFDKHFYTQDGMSEEELLLHFLLGISPNLLHLKYLFQEYISLKDKRVPSLNVGVYLAGGVAGVEALKMLLNRGDVLSSPYAHQFDCYRNLYKIVKVRGGWRTIWHKIKLYLGKKKLSKLAN